MIAADERGTKRQWVEGEGRVVLLEAEDDRRLRRVQLREVVGEVVLNRTQRPAHLGDERRRVLANSSQGDDDLVAEPAYKVRERTREIDTIHPQI